MNSRQIAADVKEILVSQGEVLCGGIICISYQTNGNHAIEPKTVGHIISERHWKSTFDFSEIYKLRVEEARSSITNCEIYSPIFSETIHTILKIL